MLSIDVPHMVYDIGGQQWMKGAPGFAEAIAKAYVAHQRPRCLCAPDGTEMYVARLGEGYIVKRMPDTGNHHAPDCPSYEPPAEYSGLGQVLGSAIIEDSITGETLLKLDFPLTKMPERSQMPPVGGESDSVTSEGTKLTLRGLLHYLWDQAELTRWHPGFTGKRTWTAVRHRLLQAAEHQLARGDSLRTRLYVPEPFTPDQRDAINSRRLAHWQRAVVAPGKSQHLMILVGEVKEIAPARYGFKAVVKHLPDQAFIIHDQLYRRLSRRFEPELALWISSDTIHMVMIATFGVGSTGVPTIHELCLMPVTQQWLPVSDGFEKQLLDRLVVESRAFVKGLHYNLGRGDQIASVALTDCEGSAPLLFILPDSVGDSNSNDHWGGASAPAWVWRRSGEPMPPFPRGRAVADRPKTAGAPSTNDAANAECS